MTVSITSRFRENTSMVAADLDAFLDEIVTAFSSLTKDEFSPQAAIPNGLKTNRRSRWEPAVHIPRMEQSGSEARIDIEARIVLPFDAYLASIVVRGRAQSIGNAGDDLVIAVARASGAIYESLGSVTFNAAAPVSTQQTLFSVGRHIGARELLLVKSTFTTGGGSTTWFESLSITPRFIPLHMAPPNGIGVIGSGS